MALFGQDPGECVFHVAEDLAVTVAAMLVQPGHDTLKVQSTLLKKLSCLPQRVATRRRALAAQVVEKIA